MTDEPIEQQLDKNMAEFMKHGPGLRITTRVWVAGRDRTNGYVLLSGLGGMGVGTMWFKDDDTSRNEYSGYDDAPDLVTRSTEHGDREILSGDWPAAFARTAMGMMMGPQP